MITFIEIQNVSTKIVGVYTDPLTLAFVIKPNEKISVVHTDQIKLACLSGDGAALVMLSYETPGLYDVDPWIQRVDSEPIAISEDLAYKGAVKRA